MFSREPAIIIAALMAVIQGVAIYVTGSVETDVGWAMPLLTIVAGWLTRRKVTPVDDTPRRRGL